MLNNLRQGRIWKYNPYKIIAIFFCVTLLLIGLIFLRVVYGYYYLHESKLLIVKSDYADLGAVFGGDIPCEMIIDKKLKIRNPSRAGYDTIYIVNVNASMLFKNVNGKAKMLSGINSYQEYFLSIMSGYTMDDLVDMVNNKQSCFQINDACLIIDYKKGKAYIYKSNGL
jgi:hypothetical protein